MVVPSLPHSMSLEGLIVPSPISLTPEEYNAAMRLFDSLVNHFKYLDPIGKGFKPVTLVRLVKDEVSEKYSFFRFFFCSIDEYLNAIPKGSDFNLAQSLSCLGSFITWTTKEIDALGNRLVEFVNILIDNFFMPLKALALKTPCHTLGRLSNLQLSEEEAVSTLYRLESLRTDCLKRDRHRCVVTRKFCRTEADERYKKDKDNVKDDDGNSLLPEKRNVTDLEVAHIFPHSLMSVSSNSRERELSDSKKIAHKILNMFDPTILPYISGSDIDRPMNTLTLTREVHSLFGEYKIAFKHISGHQYEINYMDPNGFSRPVRLPVTRTLYLTPDRSIDHPSVDFLKTHYAIAKILYLSGAGERIDTFIRDMDKMERTPVDANGSTRIDEYVRFKLSVFPEVYVY